MSSTDTTGRNVIVGIAIVTLIALLYSILIAGKPLLGLSIGILLTMLYFLWRFIRAIERIARALER